MSWLSRIVRRRRPADASTRAQRHAAADAIADWIAARKGVEVFVEPKTSLSPVSMVLVAHDGEFTRRTIGSPKAAQSFAHEHRLPVYDATMVGYPQRMRDYSRRQRILEQRARRELGDD